MPEDENKIRQLHDDAYAATRAQIDANVQAMAQQMQSGSLAGTPAPIADKAAQTPGQAALQTAEEGEDDKSIRVKDAQQQGAYYRPADRRNVAEVEAAANAPAQTQNVPEQTQAATPQSASPFDDYISALIAEKNDLEEMKRKAVEADPEMMKAENSRRWLAGVNDALTSIANLIGTGNDASSQGQTYASPLVGADVNADVKRRRADIERLNSLIDAKQKEIDSANLAKGKAGQAAEERQKDRDLKAAMNTEKEETKRMGAELANATKQRAQDAKDANNAAVNAEKERHNKAQEAIGRQNANSSSSRAATARMNAETKANGGGSGRKSEVWTKEAAKHYDEFRNGVARKYGYKDWKEMEELNSMYGSKDHKVVSDLTPKGRTNGELESILSTHGETENPAFFKKYGGEYGASTVDSNGKKPMFGNQSAGKKMWGKVA